MDALAVSITCGIVMRRFHVPNALKIATLFGGFQAIMPLAGYLAGYNFKEVVSAFDHWLAFALLLIIGGKMLYESRTLKEGEEEEVDITGILSLLTLAIATSIDALAVGVTFAFLDVRLTLAVVIIGLTTFVLSLGGVIMGVKAGNFLGSKIEVAGGITLIAIGVKILIEHLFFV